MAGRKRSIKKLSSSESNMDVELPESENKTSIIDNLVSPVSSVKYLYSPSDSFVIDYLYFAKEYKFRSNSQLVFSDTDVIQNMEEIFLKELGAVRIGSYFTNRADNSGNSDLFEDILGSIPVNEEDKEADEDDLSSEISDGIVLNEELYLVDNEIIFYIAMRRSESSLCVSAAFNNQEHLHKLEKLIRTKILKEKKVSKKKGVTIRFWNLDGGDVRTIPRYLELPEGDISNNYTGNAVAGINELLEFSPPIKGGKLILIHGEPGTGKTSFIVHLAKRWEQWCSVHYITDPEKFFNTISYVEELTNFNVSSTEKLRLRNKYGEYKQNNRYNLLVVEDADEYLSCDAKSVVGQSLSRLLNLSDGMIGLGLRFMIMLTTNEKIEKIHPAVLRPGRCRMDIEMGKFNKNEANAWFKNMGIDYVSDSDMTLAEMYNISNSSYRLDKKSIGFG